jgi:hypothetical protein
VILQIANTPVASAPLEMVIDMLATGDEILVLLARNLYGTISPTEEFPTLKVEYI